MEAWNSLTKRQSSQAMETWNSLPKRQLSQAMEAWNALFKSLSAVCDYYMCVTWRVSICMSICLSVCLSVQVIASAFTHKGIQQVS